jgi:hypothetical protein
MRISSVQPGGGDAAGAVPEEVGRVVLARGVAGDGVVLDAARVGEEHLCGLAVVLGIDDHPAVVGVAGHEVVIAERCLDGLDVGVLEVEGGVEELVVVGEPGDVFHLGLEVVAGVGFVPGGDLGRFLPARVGEVAVHLDRLVDAIDAQGGGRRGEGGGRALGGGSAGGGEQGDREGRPGDGASVQHGWSHRSLRWWRPEEHTGTTGEG